MKNIYNDEVKNKNGTIENRAAETSDPTDRPVLQLDVDYYQSFLDDEDLSEAQKKELLETIWNIVVTFVDLGFGIEPVQVAIEAGKNNTQDMIRPDSDSVKQAEQTDKMNTTSAPIETKEIT